MQPDNKRSNSDQRRSYGYENQAQEFINETGDVPPEISRHPLKFPLPEKDKPSSESQP